MIFQKLLTLARPAQICIFGQYNSKCCAAVLQILRMEHLVLKVLDFQVAVPTVNFFCDKFLGDISADDKTKSLAMVSSVQSFTYQYLNGSWTKLLKYDFQYFSQSQRK